MNTIFFGSSKFVLPIVTALAKKYKLSLVVTTEHDKNGPVTQLAIKHKIPYLDLTKCTDEAIEKIKSLNVSFAVLAYFGLILPQKLLDVFPKGIINVHPSLLPKYRGPTPGQAAILNDTKTTGVSIMKLDQEVDHGPILAQQEAECLPNDTSETLYTRLFEQGTTMLLDALPNYLEGNLQLAEQDHTQATFTNHLTRESGYIPFEKLDKGEIERLLRAYFPWPGVWTTIQINERELRVKFLPENKIQVEGKKPVSYKDFLNGYTFDDSTKQKLTTLLTQ